MKKLFSILLVVCLSLTLTSQSDIGKALELHRLDQGLAFANGIKTKAVQGQIVEKRTIDFTVKPQKESFEYVITEKDATDATGYIYGFDMAKTFAGATGISANGVATYMVTKPHTFVTISSGPFQNETYWNAWHEWTLTDTPEGCVYRVIWEQGDNTITSGTNRGKPEPTGGLNPTMSVIRHEYAITKIGQPARKMNETTAFVKKADLISRTGWTDRDIANARGITVYYTEFPATTHISNIATDIVETGDKLRMDVYFNGILSSQINYKAMFCGIPMTDDNGKRALKKHGGYVQRWILKNNGEKTVAGGYNTSAYGATWSDQSNKVRDDNGVYQTCSACVHNELTLVAGSTASMDYSTYTLTYNANTKVGSPGTELEFAL